MALHEGDLLAGKYRIERMLGEGGMGTVYLAVNQVLQKKVALKVMSHRFTSVPIAVERFVREAVAASRVSHPSIVQVFDAGHHEGAPWIAMELLEGESLGQRLERGPLSVDEALKMADGVLSALAEVHDEGIVHRDLKPDNIFLATARGGDWVPKVLDFGVAKDTSDGELSKLTATGAVVGTAHYISPEQARGLSDIDARADVYAMGVVLFESLSGQMPYDAQTLTQLIAKMFTEEPQPLVSVAPHVPEAISQVIQTCLEQDRGKRFQTARALLGALRAASGASEVPFGRSSAPGAPGTAWPAAPQRQPPQPDAIPRTALSAAVAPSHLTRATTPSARRPSGSRLLLVAGVLGVFVLGAVATGAAWLALGPHEPVAREAAPPSLVPTVVEADADEHDEEVVDQEVAAAEVDEVPAEADLPAVAARPARPRVITPAPEPELAETPPEPVPEVQPEQVETTPERTSPRDRRGGRDEERSRPSRGRDPSGAAGRTSPPSGTGLTQADVLRTIQQRVPVARQRCYQPRQQVVPGLRGLVTVAWTVLPNGGVHAAHVVHNGTGDEWLARCTVGVVAETRFTPAANGVTTPGRYPFQFP